MNKPNDLSLTNAQTIQPDGDRDAYFVIGDDRAQFAQGDTVAVAVSVNFTLRDGERTRGHAIPLHEIPLLRRLYSNGTVSLHTEWVPGVNRSVPMTRRMFEEETKRLVRAYTIPREAGQASKFFAEVYGETEADATKKLHAGMKALYDGWKALEKKAVAAFKKAGGDLATQPKGAIHGLLSKFFTVDDLEALIALVEPKTKTLENVDLASIEVDGDTGTEEAIPGDEIRQGLAAEMVKAGLSKAQADEMALCTIEAGHDLADDLLMTSSLAVEGVIDMKLAKKARKVAAAWAERQKVTT